MIIGERKHTFPSRTRSLSSQPPMVVRPRCRARVGRCQSNEPRCPRGCRGSLCIYHLVIYLNCRHSPASRPISLRYTSVSCPFGQSFSFLFNNRMPKPPIFESRFLLPALSDVLYVIHFLRQKRSGGDVDKVAFKHNCIFAVLYPALELVYDFL